MAKYELFQKPLIGWVVKSYGAFPVRRGENDKQSFRKALEILRAGGVLGMFPEGTRSKTGTLQRGHPGAALLAVRGGAPVVPVGLVGTKSILRFPDLFVRPVFEVRIGRPFTVSTGNSGGDRLSAATDEMMGRIADLLPDEQRGSYSTSSRRTSLSLAGDGDEPTLSAKEQSRPNAS
jgi:1-acyl-sn-glycerol-3-phosphate acyltransferase